MANVTRVVGQFRLWFQIDSPLRIVGVLISKMAISDCYGLGVNRNAKRSGEDRKRKAS